MDADTEQLIREMWADLAAGHRRINAELGSQRAELASQRAELVSQRSELASVRAELAAFRSEVHARFEHVDTRLERLEGLMFVVKRNFEAVDLRFRTLEAR